MPQIFKRISLAYTVFTCPYKDTASLANAKNSFTCPANEFLYNT